MVTLYLDLDGVVKILHGSEARHGSKLWAYDKTLVSRVQRLVLAAEVEHVVISSSLRYQQSVPEFRQELEALGFHELAARIVRTTPTALERVPAILDDAQTHKPEAWVVLDDYRLDLPKGNQVLTSSQHGITDRDAVTAIGYVFAQLHWERPALDLARIEAKALSAYGIAFDDVPLVRCAFYARAITETQQGLDTRESAYEAFKSTWTGAGLDRK